MLGKERGVPKFKLNATNNKIVVDKNLADIRPYIGAFIAKNCRLNNYVINQIIQLQEKLCDNYGKKREKIAIGVYKHKKIIFPVYYKAVAPEAKFVPLGLNKEMALNEILAEHPKGREYSNLLKDFIKYPILVDSKNKVLSFPPIINSADCGKVDEADKELLVEVTGTDINAVHLAVNIFSQALYDRGCQIYSVHIDYPGKKITTPCLFNERIKISSSDIEKILGIKLTENQIKGLLEKARFNYQKGFVLIPHYRKDIMHAVDVVEDIGIMYGYNKLPDSEPASYTKGQAFPLIKFIDKLRELLIGLNHQEVLSQILSNKNILYNNMNLASANELIEIDNIMSETYSAVRTWLIPILLEVLSKNKHVEHPQKIFEQGLVTKKDNSGKIFDCESFAVLTCHKKAGYTEVRQILDYMLNTLHVEYVIDEKSHSSFIPGRVASATVHGKEIAVLGELHPAVLKNFGLEMPVAALELDVGLLFELVNS